MQYINTEIYSQVYEIVENNLDRSNEANQKIPVSKEVFLSTIGDSGESIDLSKFKDVPREEFLDSMYVKILGRTSGDKAKKRYSDIGYLDDAEWKKQVVEGIISLGEFRAKKRTIANNIFE